MTRLSFSLLLAAALTAAPDAQAPASLSFEVASVKPNKSGEPFIRFGMQPGGRFTATNVPARELIRFAYRVQDFQMIGLPDWTRSERFDVVAKMPDGTAMGQMGPGSPPGPQELMLRTLLAERFKLQAHMETREMPVYALVLARADKKPGPKLAASQTDCPALMKARMAAGGSRPAPPPPPKPGEPMQCGMMMGPGNMGGGAVPITALVTAISQRMSRAVIDRTGLTGNWDFTLSFMPDQMPQLPPGGLPAGAVGPPPIDPNAPSLQTALEEQLGLKLESTKGSVDVLVIDSVTPPTPD
jgi:bla regulator protein blaR1